ncbi:carboxynorspermidine decarboxylase, partial [Desulfococcaceae bacterium OttesenSCG-928-F15]|nr:carboxynorspermidine decarboxylase [Desulfococcaceae bacterium OttesenSCG-928-F15]
MNYGDPGFDPLSVQTPAFVVDERLIAKNLAVLESVKEKTGCKILLALKAFSMFSTFPLIQKSLDGICASSVHEAELGRENFKGEVHAFAAGFSASDLKFFLPLCDHLVFNSFSLWERFRDKVFSLKPGISCGMRVNPECSVGHTPMYDPCAPGSRLGAKKKDFREDLLEGIEGLHFHALCEQDSLELERVLHAFLEKFGKYLPQMRWLNLGGGHHITKKGYHIEKLLKLLLDLKEKYPHLTLYLEPGEAVVLNTGFFVSEVLDIAGSDFPPHAILDASAACHMPDVLEMPYRPEVISAGKVGEKPFSYQLGGLSCLAGDRIGTYSFDQALKIGDRLVFTDMAHYSMVKTNTFNGIPLPSIYRIDLEGKLHLERAFGY